MKLNGIDEYYLLTNYRMLDERGKEDVFSTLNISLKYILKEPKKKENSNVNNGIFFNDKKGSSG